MEKNFLTTLLLILCMMNCKNESNSNQPIQFKYQYSINSTFNYPSNVLETKHVNLHYIDTLQLSKNEINCIQLKFKNYKLDTIKNSFCIHRRNFNILPSFDNLIFYSVLDSATISFNSIERLIPDSTSSSYKFMVYNFEKEKNKYETKYHNIIRFKLTLDSILNNNKTFKKRRIQSYNYMIAHPIENYQ